MCVNVLIYDKLNSHLIHNFAQFKKKKFARPLFATAMNLLKCRCRLGRNSMLSNSYQNTYGGRSLSMSCTVSK